MGGGSSKQAVNTCKGGGDEYCKDEAKAGPSMRCEMLGENFFCLCDDHHNSEGLNYTSKCVDAGPYASFTQKGLRDLNDGMLLQQSQQSSSEWLWGLGGFLSALLLMFVMFFVRWLVRGKKKKFEAGEAPITTGKNYGTVRQHVNTSDGAIC